MFFLGCPSLYQHGDLILMNIRFELLDHRLLTSHRKPRTPPSLAASTSSPNPRIERSKQSSLNSITAPQLHPAFCFPPNVLRPLRASFQILSADNPKDTSSASFLFSTPYSLNTLRPHTSPPSGSLGHLNLRIVYGTTFPATFSRHTSSFADLPCICYSSNFDSFHEHLASDI
jgi:hypothetical protein